MTDTSASRDYWFTLVISINPEVENVDCIWWVEWMQLLGVYVPVRAIEAGLCWAFLLIIFRQQKRQQHKNHKNEQKIFFCSGYS